MSDLRLDWATYKAARYACQTWHYSKSFPAGKTVKVGAWESGSFIGVVVFSRGANKSLFAPYGLKTTEGCELARVALTDHRAPVSQILAGALRILRRQCPGLRCVISFADPAQGHHGGVYQAGNWIYTGQSQPSAAYVGPSGKRWHPRMISPTGWKVSFGVRKRVLRPDQCTRIELPGKHRYMMPLDKRLRRQLVAISKPYPKCVQSIVSDALDDQSREGGAIPTCTLQSSGGADG